MTKPHAYCTIVADAAGSGHLWTWACAYRSDSAQLRFATGLFKTPVRTISEAEFMALVNGLIEADNHGYLPLSDAWVELHSDSMAALRTLATHCPRLCAWDSGGPHAKGARRKPLTDLEKLGLNRIRDLCYHHGFALRLVYTHGHTAGSLSSQVDRNARAAYRDEARLQGVTKHAQSFPTSD